MQIQHRQPPTHPSSHSKMTLATDAIKEDGTFDPRYTCDLDNSSPELHWNQFPETTAGFALIVEDRDSLPEKPPEKFNEKFNEKFIHWLIYNIPLSINHLPAGIPPQEALPNGILQGINGFGKLGYTGPCPPYGDRPHHYAFRVFALNKLIPLSHRLSREALMTKIEPYIVATGEITGSYRRAVQKAG